MASTEQEQERARLGLTPLQCRQYPVLSCVSSSVWWGAPRRPDLDTGILGLSLTLERSCRQGQNKTDTSPSFSQPAVLSPALQESHSRA